MPDWLPIEPLPEPPEWMPRVSEAEELRDWLGLG